MIEPLQATRGRVGGQPIGGPRKLRMGGLQQRYGLADEAPEWSGSLEGPYCAVTVEDEDPSTMPSSKSTVKQHRPSVKTTSGMDAAADAEEHIPFDQVLRKLVSAPPAHKTAKGPVKRNASKPPRKA